MKSWIYLFDHEDLSSVVDMVETTGTSYIPSIDSGEVGDTVFIGSGEYGGRILYMTTVTDIRGYVAEDGEVFFDTIAERGMLIVDELRFASLQKEGLPELKEGEAVHLAEAFAEKLKACFATLDDYGNDEAIDVKQRIISDARTE